MEYTVGEYVAGGTYVHAEKDGEPWADASVCLVDYGILPPKDQIIIPAYNLSQKDVDTFIEDLAEEVLGTVLFGPFSCKGIKIKLKPQYVK